MDTTVRDRRKWTPEEDALLTRAMKRYRYLQDVRWTDVAATIPDRTPKACRKRWVNGLNDRLKKGSWTSEEDDRLREGVAMLNSDWARIAEHVGQRSGDQCSKRWREVLDPAINKSPWTPEEDKMLTELYHKHGSSWQVISTHFNNRRALQCRNRCCKLLGLHGTSRSVPQTPSFEPMSDQNALSSGEISTAAATPVSPFGLSFPAIPTTVPTFKQDELWSRNVPVDMSQASNMTQVKPDTSNNMGCLLDASTITEQLISPTFGDAMRSTTTDCPVSPAEWSLAPASSLPKRMTTTSDMLSNNIPRLDSNDLLSQQLFSSPGSLTPTELMSGPSTPSMNLPHSRCNSGFSMSSMHNTYGNCTVGDMNSMTYPLPTSQPNQAVPQWLQGISGNNANVIPASNVNDMGLLVFPMQEQLSSSIGMPKESELINQMMNQDPLQWMTGIFPTGIQHQYAV
ncbi:hypothetical protein MCUN1_001966 [Malassezia cuniculi]|uniref:Myb-like domain-containing protein n=1 Tax=Malassezia cuniculi TaxID=948313 RepID=A0AAF0EUY8_9BASI|nr:hypothetical protein MCUN1_001966 [Malassezia cuniculi]